MAIRYIGSKARLVDALAPFIASPGDEDGLFVDAFCGTGVVAELAARQGWDVHLNDQLRCAATLTAARLAHASEAPFKKFGGYQPAIEQLNSLPEKRGFIWREYSPASKRHADVERRYFTEANAARIDAIRQEIARWKQAGWLSNTEELVLIADLLGATNRVANIAGTYGCFLSHWTDQARERLLISPRTFFSRRVRLRVSLANVANLRVGTNDLVYLDPPYTKRQYAAYYHILETIAAGDSPQVGGITGLRPWQDKASDFCYRVRALDAITSLVARLPARRILLSYSNQGHVALGPLKEALRPLGDVRVARLKEIGRYRPNRAASSAGSAVAEYLLVIEKAEATSTRELVMA